MVLLIKEMEGVVVEEEEGDEAEEDEAEEKGVRKIVRTEEGDD